MRRLIRTIACFLFLSSFPTTMLLHGQQSQPAADPAFDADFQRARVALSGGNYAEAIDAFKKANKLRNNHCSDCYLGLAAAYLRAGDLEQALASCDKALNFAEDDARRGNAHWLKGNVILALAPHVSKEFQKAEEEYRLALKLRPDNPMFHMNLARVLLKQSKDQDAIDELKKCLASNPTDAIAEEAKQLIAEPRRGREDFAPDFHFTTMQGQEVSLKQLAGKVVVLDFWATWCPPCRASVGELKDLTRKYPSDRLVLISISADHDEAAWRDFIAKKKMDWPQFRDLDGYVAQSLSVHEFPTYLVIDGEGVVRARIVGRDERESVVYRLKNELAAMPPLAGTR